MFMSSRSAFLLCLTLVLTVFLSGCGNRPPASTGSLRGTIVDAETGGPVAGAVVVTVGTNPPITVTGGSFVVSNLPPGWCQVSARAAGYANFERTAQILLSKTTQLSIALQRLPQGSSMVRGWATLTNDPYTYPSAAPAAGAASKALRSTVAPVSSAPVSAMAMPFDDSVRSLQVRPAHGVSDDEFRAKAAEAGYEVEVFHPLTGIYVIRKRTTTLRAASFDAEGEAIALSSSPFVDWAYPDYPVYATALEPNDPAYRDHQWHYRAISLPRAWSVTNGMGSPVTVAVLDTGIRPEHPDLGTNIVTGWDFVNGDNDPTDTPDPNNSMKGASHGTHVAGTVGAVTNNGLGVAGVNWGVRIMPVRVLDSMGSGSYSLIAEAIMWAADHGAHVINMSLSGRSEPGPSLRDAVRYALNKGVTLVAAAGNSYGAVTEYPAALPGVISVSATDRGNELAIYSSYGPSVTLSAPGGSKLEPGGAVFSTFYTATDPNNFNNYGWMQGTSMATPHVSGLVSLMISSFGSMTPEEITRRLCDTAQDLGDIGRDDLYGSGLINGYAAMTQSTMDKAVFAVMTNSDSPELKSSPVYALRDRSFQINDAQAGDFVLVGWLDVDGDGLLSDGDFYGYQMINIPSGSSVNLLERVELRPYDASSAAYSGIGVALPADKLKP